MASKPQFDRNELYDFELSINDRRKFKIIVMVENIIKGTNSKSDEINLDNCINFLALLSGVRRDVTNMDGQVATFHQAINLNHLNECYADFKLDEVMDIFIIDTIIFLRMKDGETINFTISDDHICNLLKGILNKYLEEKKTKYDIITENECYGLKDKKGNIIFPPVLPVAKYSQQEIYNIKEVKEIMKDTYLVITCSGYSGMLKDGEKLPAQYDSIEFDGYNFNFKSDDDFIKDSSIEGSEVWSHYIDSLKQKDKQEPQITSGNIIEKIKEAIPSIINFSLTQDKVDIINDHVIVFKIESKGVCVVDLNQGNPLILLLFTRGEYKLLNNNSLLGKDYYFRYCIYDIEHQNKILFQRGRINEDAKFLLVDNKNNLYDIRTGFYSSNKYSVDFYDYIHLEDSEYVTLNDKVFYTKKDDENKTVLGVYDLETGENKKEDKFTEFREINVAYDKTFIIESKDGERLFDEPIETIYEVTDIETLKDFDLNNSQFENISYIINGKLYFIYKASGRTHLFHLLMVSEDETQKLSKPSVLRKK